jgi:integrase
MKRTTESPSTKTWGNALDYTAKHRWKPMASYGTNMINSGHITNLIGRSYCLSKMSAPAFWRNLITELRDVNPLWQDATINRITTAGRTVLRTVIEDELVSFALPKIPKLKEGESRRTYYTKDEVERLVFTAIDVFARSDIADIMLFAAYTGGRQAELLKLKVGDVDWSSNVIWFGGRPGLITKGKEVRAVPVADRIIEITQKRSNGRRPDELLFGDDWTNKDQLVRTFTKVKECCGFDRSYVFHSFRHSFGTWIGEVAHPRQIMSLMGHKDVETSLRYTKATDAANRAAIEALSP